MKRFSVIFLFLFAFTLGFYFIFSSLTPDTEQETIRAKVVIPATTNQVEQSEDTESYSSVEFENTSLVQLNLDETLINLLSTLVSTLTAGFSILIANLEYIYFPPL